ncbi:MAG: hypothetical protein ACTSRR_09880 [Candidatus Heimdallarchaeaceae archaeon]
MKRNIILYSLVMMLIISNVMNISLNSDIQQNGGTTQIETDSINSGYPENAKVNTQESYSYLQQSDLSALQQSYATTDNSYKVNMATVDTSTWYQGETIKTEMKFNKQIPDYYTYTSELYHSGSTTPFEDVDIAIISPGASLKDDSSNTYIIFSPDSDISIANYIRTTFYSKIYAGGSGALYAQGYACWYYSGSSYYSTSVTSDSYTISTSYLDGSGYLHIYVNIYADDSADKLTFMVGFMNYETGNYETVLQIEKTGCGSSNFHLATAVIDYLYFQREEIIDNVRSTYKYTTQTTKIHKLEIYSIANVESISIYFPDYMTFSSISPIASYSLSSNTIVVNNPVELKYTFFFTSQCNNKLAIKDITSAIFTDSDFESDYNYDFKNHDSYPFSSINLVSDKVFSGAFSVHLSDSDSSTDYFRIVKPELKAGYYYVSFSYWTELDSGDFRFYARYGGSGTGIHYLDSTNNYWKTVFIYDYFEPESDGTIADFLIAVGQGDVWIDNVRFFKPSTTIQTIGVNEYEIISTLISWDGYKNPTIPYEEVNFDLIDRTEQTLEESYATITDENGIATWTLEKSLEQKEYQINAYCEDSYFMNNVFEPYDIIEQINDIDSAEFDVMTIEEFTTYENRGTVWHTIAYDDDANSYIRFSTTSTIYDFSNFDYYAFDFYANVSSATGDLLIQTDWTNRLEKNNGFSYSTGWNTYVHSFLTFNEIGDFDVTNVDFWRIDSDYTGSIELYVDAMHFVHASKLYFTPSYPQHTDYAETELLDAIDWSEGDKEDFSKYSSAGIVSNPIETIENGKFILEFEASGSTNVVLIYRKTVTIDYAYYSFWSFRVRTNNTMSNNLRFYAYDTTDGDLMDGNEHYFTSTDFEYDLLEIDSNDQELKSEITFIIYCPQAYASGSAKIELDFIRLVHIEEPVLYETDTTFYLSSTNNTYQYAIYSDDNYLGIYNDLDTILKNNTVGTHNFTSVLFSNGENKAFLSETYTYLYEIDPEPFSITINSFYLTDNWINTYFTPNMAGTYYVYENNSLITSNSFSDTGTTISTERSSLTNVIINYAIKFTNNTETIWFNTTYQNAKDDYYLTYYAIEQTDTTINVYWNTSLEPDYATMELHDAWDFNEGDTEGWEDVNPWFKSITVENGICTLITKSGISTTYIYYEINNLAIDSSYYTHFQIRLKSNITWGEDYAYSFQVYDGHWGNILAKYTSPIYANEWTIITLDLSQSNDWTGMETGLFILWQDSPDTIAENVKIDIDYIKLLHGEVTVIEDGQEIISSSQEYPISWTKLTEIGTHYVTVIWSIDDYQQIIKDFTYEVDNSGIMKIIIHDQSGNSLEFDSFKVYIDGARLYDQYIYFEDISQSFNLTITDLFDNQLYTNATETFENFKEIQLTLYSVKIQNIQDNPIWVEFKRGTKTFSEWIFTYEVIEYKLEEATYTLTIYYSDVSDDFSVATNGTYVSYSYYINVDTAIRVTGRTIEDVFGNVLSLSDELEQVNATITNQIISVNLTVSNVNNSISNQIVDVNIYLENTNTSLSNQIISIQTDLYNVNSTLYSQTVTILTDLYNVNSTLFDQTITILSDIANVNATLYSQTLSILSSVSNVNSTLYEQTVTILSDIANVNSTLYSQTLTILNNIENVNSTLYSQTLTILSDISNVNVTLYEQTLTILSDVQNVNTTLYSQTVSILSNISNVNSTLYSQTLTILSEVENTNTTLYQQTLDIISYVQNTNSTLYSQTVTILSDIVNVNSTLYSQTIDILSDISNVNTTLYSQTVTILSDIQNTNATLYSQTISILSDIVNVNSTLYSQTLTILSDIQNTNSTLYSQTVSILSNIQNVNTTLYAQTVTILSKIENTNSTLYQQTLTILSDIQNTNSTLYSQTISILSDIQNVNSTLYNQTVTILSEIQNTNSTLYAQTVTILSDIQNINSTLYSQTVDILSEIYNTNSTLYDQTLTILSNIQNTNTTLYQQTITIISNIENVNSTLYSQTLTILSDIQNTNATLYDQTVSILSDIVNVNTTLYQQTLTILSDVQNVNSTLYSQTVTILSNIQNTNSTLYSQTIDILTEIDLTNSTQVALILTNYQEILETQQLAAEYMSSLRIESFQVIPGADYLDFYIQTNWKNATVTIYDNDTLIVSVLEADIIRIDFATDYGLHNLTISIVSGSYVFNLTYLFNYVQSDVYYNCHIDIYSQTGLGLDFDTAKAYMNYINDSFRLTQDFITTEQNFTLYIVDFFNVTLAKINVTLYSNVTINYIEVQIDYYLAEFVNSYDCDVLLTITRNFISYDIVISANSTIYMALSSGVYQITNTPITLTNKYSATTDEWATTSQIKRYRVYLTPKATYQKQSVDPAQLFIRIIYVFATAGGMVAGTYYFYERVVRPIKREFGDFKLKYLFDAKRKKRTITLLFALLGLFLVGLIIFQGG